MKIKTIIIVLALIFIILSGFLVYERIKKEEEITIEEELPQAFEPAYQPLEVCYNIKNPSERQECIDMHNRIEAEFGLDIKACLALKNEHNKIRCIRWVAMREDHAYCEYIEDEKQKEICYAECASWNEDVAICNYLEEGHEKDECAAVVKSTIATKNLDMNSCLNISVMEYQNLCFENIAQFYGIDYCEDLGEFKDRCISVIYFNQAHLDRNISLCEEIPLYNYREVCKIRLSNWDTDPRLLDTDHDGIDNGNELFLGTDPFNLDTDGDGKIDSWGG